MEDSNLQELVDVLTTPDIEHLTDDDYGYFPNLSLLQPRQRLAVECALIYMEPSESEFAEAIKAGAAKDLFRFSKKLYERYEDEKSDASYIEAAVICSTTALVLHTKADELRFTMVYRMGPMLRCHYEQTGKPEDLDMAVDTAEELLSFTQSDNTEMRAENCTAMENLADALLWRHQERPNYPSDLQRAATLSEQLVNQTAHSRAPINAAYLVTWANVLKEQFKIHLSISYLDNAIMKTTEAISLLDSNVDKAELLMNLSNLYHLKYEHTTDEDCLHNAVGSAEEALSLYQCPDASRAAYLSAHAVALGSKYSRYLDINDLESSIQALREATAIEKAKDYDKGMWLGNLADKLCTRFERFGELADLDGAVTAARESTALCVHGTSSWISCSNTLAAVLARRLERKADKETLEHALQVLRDVIAVLEQFNETNPEWGGYYANLGWVLQRKYEMDKEMATMCEAIEMARKAVDLTPTHHPIYSLNVDNLGSRLITLFEITNCSEHLTEAIDFSGKAVQAVSDDRMEKCQLLHNLGRKLRILHQRGQGESQHEEEALSCFIEASRNRYGSPLTRIECARAAIDILISRAEPSDWTNAGELATEAVHLIPQVCRRYTSREDQQHAIEQIHGLAADAASLSLQARNPDTALKQLEFGRGLILGYMRETRGDLEELRKCNKDLADRYDMLRLKAFRDIERTETRSVAEKLIKERRDAVTELTNCLHEIRRVSGYERFLMEPEVHELRKQAAEGPIVVINMTDIRADAIIVTADAIQAIPLPELSRRTAPLQVKQDLTRLTYIRRAEYERTRDIVFVERRDDTELYEWLWNYCVKEVIDKLNLLKSHDGAELPRRIWWIGSGLASSFPFHAASVDGSCALEYMVPSYTPTIKMLTYGRAQTTKHDTPRILLVTMPETMGHSPLPGAEKEREIISNICRTKSTACQDLPFPTVDDVLNGIPGSTIAHFACHAVFDPYNPSRSYLILKKGGAGDKRNGALDIATLSQVAAQRHSGMVAFLAACSTAKTQDYRYADEGHHLVGAFLAAGYAHAIGTLWPAGDDICPKIAEKFYEKVLQSRTSPVMEPDRAVAVALWSAVKSVRSEHPEPRHWAPFVHFGI